VNGRESTTGAFGVQHKQLLAERQIFEDKILARAEDGDYPTDQVPEEGDHGPRILSHSLKWKTWKSFVSRLLEVLRRHTPVILMANGILMTYRTSPCVRTIIGSSLSVH